jgi:integrase
MQVVGGEFDEIQDASGCSQDGLRKTGGKMAVYDRWHKSPQPGDEPCRCGRGRNRLYPSAAHGQGRRWEVRWRSPVTGKQEKRSFDLRDGPDRNIHADAYDKHIQGQIVARNYTDPRAGEVTFQSYAETWRATRTHSAESAAALAARLRNHVYEGEPDSGMTPSGGVAIGQHSMALLSQRPTLAAAWVASLSGPLPAEGSRRQVVDDAGAVFRAAVQDGVIGRNPLEAGVVAKPGRGRPKAQPFTRDELAAVAAALPPRLRVLPELGAGTGMRAMELAALGVHDFQMLGRSPHVRVERQLKKTGGALVFAPIKNRKPHRVPLAPVVARAVARHLDEHPPREVTLPWHDPRHPKEHGRLVTVRLVLLDSAGAPLTPWTLHDAWRAAAAKALRGRPGSRGRVTGQNMHRMRHTYASAQLRAGVDVVRVAAAMGDTADVVVKTYAHLMRDDDGDAALRDAVDVFLGSSAPDVPQEEVSGTSAQASGT